MSRNYARERTRHAALAPETQRALYALLRAQLPDRDHALVGWPSILAELDRLGIRRPNGGPLTRRIVMRWARGDGFPLVRGTWLPQRLTPSLTTTFAVTAWMLSRLDTGRGFRVYGPVSSHPDGLRGSTPRSHARAVATRM
jgi:hypothetical protein